MILRQAQDDIAQSDKIFKFVLNEIKEVSS